MSKYEKSDFNENKEAKASTGEESKNGRRSGGNKRVTEKGGAKSADKTRANRRRGAEPRNSGNVNKPANPIAAQRVRDITALNFDYPITDTVGVFNNLNANAVVREDNVFVINYVPTLGASAGANLSSQKLFGELRKVLNVPSTYEGGDLFMYDLAVESLDQAVEYFKRIVRLANTYVTRNFLYPKWVLRALGWDLDEIVANLPAYREAINRTITAMQYLTVPYVTKSHALRMYLNGAVFLDEEAEKAQNIVFNPEGFWQWNLAAGSSTTPSDLAWVKLPKLNNSTTYSLYTVQNLLSTLMSSLIYDTDGQRIHGDILKVWPDCLKLGGDVVTEADYEERTFDPYIMYMLHNATIFDDIGGTDPTISWNIPSGSTSPSIVQTVNVDSEKLISDVDLLDVWEGADSSVIIDMCRWKAYTSGVTSSATATQNVPITMSGTAMPLEVLTGICMYEFNNLNGSFSTYRFGTSILPNNGNVTHQELMSASVWALHPVFYLKENVGTSSSPSYQITRLFGDRGHYTLIDHNYVSRLGVVATEINYDL